MIYRRLARPLLFRFDEERAHGLAMNVMAGAARAPWRPPTGEVDPRLRQSIAGIEFPNPVGLAAGFDKYAAAIPAWPRLGFGFVEVGTITMRPQAGNPRPRMFRLPAQEALINRLGFNNAGASATARRLRDLARQGQLGLIPLGVNIGRSQLTAPEAAAADYAASLDRLWPYADYLAINVSSPNTPGLRDLQEHSALDGLLGAIAEVNRARAADVRRDPIPTLVKIAPDLEPAQLDAVVDLAIGRGVAGLIVGNTTLDRSAVVGHPRAVEAGGLSGRPLGARSTALVRHVASRARGRLVIVGVGGIFSGADAWEKIAAGACLVQLYTGLVYEGPSLPRRIAEDLAARVTRAGATSIAEVVGSG